MTSVKTSVRQSSPGRRIAIIAGNGRLPSHLMDELESCGQSPVLIGIEGEIDPVLQSRANAVLTFGQIGRLFKILEIEGVGQVVFAGGVRRRPDFKNLKLDLLTVKELPNLIRIVLGGDNTVLEKIAEYFEKKNVKVVGSHEVAPGLVAPAGAICGKLPAKATMQLINQGFQAAKAIGALDVGQAAVAEDGRVIALEGLEGTDAMLERVAGLRRNGRLTKSPKLGILVKAMKPKQDMRADLPAIGPQTIESVSAAGLKGIVIEAGRSLILGGPETLEKAKQAGVFIYGHEEK